MTIAVDWDVKNQTNHVYLSLAVQDFGVFALISSQGSEDPVHVHR